VGNCMEINVINLSFSKPQAGMENNASVCKISTFPGQ